MNISYFNAVLSSLYRHYQHHRYYFAKPSLSKNLVVLAHVFFVSIISSSPLYAATPSQNAVDATVKSAQKVKAQQSAKKSVKKTKERRKAHKKPITETAASDTTQNMADDHTEKWMCKDRQAFVINGDMKKDLILSMRWNGRTYKLPRIETTTGADRFYDPATGYDLVVIPEKAMLFNSKGNRTRLADNCKTEHMIATHSVTPTQSNALLPNTLSDEIYR